LCASGTSVIDVIFVLIAPLNLSHDFGAMSRDSSVGISTSYGLNGRCSVHCRDNTFLCSQPEPHTQWDPMAVSPGVRQPGPEAQYYHLLQRSIMVELHTLLHTSSLLVV
jgi:hypothetical protein